MALSPTGDVDDSVLVNGRYAVHPDRELADLNVGPAKAFAATELRDTSRPVFALLSDTRYPPRFDLVQIVRRIDHQNLVRVIDWGVVPWPTDHTHKAAVVLERPKGGKVLPSLSAEIMPFKEEALIRRVIHPMTQVLSECYYQGISHRNIRPDNLFYDGAPDVAPIMLGDGLSSPAGVAQAIGYETIDCGMADPAGRGEGDSRNDLYALGVTMIALLLGHCPFRGMSDEEILQKKMELGSYHAMLGDIRVSLTVMEVLRGLLNDDVNERWGVDNLDKWVGGRRLSPKQQIMPAKAGRPLEFAGKEHYMARDVAEAFSRNWDAAIGVVSEGTLDHWLRRSLADESRTEAVKIAKEFGRDMDDSSKDAMLARVCIALDPLAPLRLRAFRATLDGVGQLISSRHNEEAICDLFRQLMRENLLAFWMDMRQHPAPDHFRFVSLYEKTRPYLERPAIGQGIERAVYDLDPTSPCRSPLLQNEFVVTMDQLLPALERAAASNPGNAVNLVDRHVAAFITARMKASIASHLRELEEAATPIDAALASTRILAAVQDNTVTHNAPAICAAAAAMLEVCADRYYNLSRRKAVVVELKKTAKAGIIRDLLTVIDNQEDLSADLTRYQFAVSEYVSTLLQLQRLEYERANRKNLAKEFGAQISSLVAGAVATVAVLVTVLVKLF